MPEESQQVSSHEALSGARFSEFRVFGRRSRDLTRADRFSDQDDDGSDDADPDVNVDLRAGVVGDEDSFGLVLRLDWKSDEVDLAIEAGQRIIVEGAANLPRALRDELIVESLFPQVIGYCTGWMSSEALVLGLDAPEFDLGLYQTFRQGLSDYLSGAMEAE